jgi:type III secretion protein U
MSEKTEQPTAKKRNDARKRGQVAKSVEVTSGVQLAVLFGYFFFEGADMLESFKMLVDVSVGTIGGEFLVGIADWLKAFTKVLIRFMLGMAFLVIAMTMSAVVAQIGPLFAPEALKLSLEKVNPLSNLKQIFSIKGLFEFIKSLFKVVTLSCIFFYLMRQYMPSLQFLPFSDVDVGLSVATQLLGWMWAALIGAYVVFAMADFSFQRYSMTNQLKMSIQDIKQEFKDSEGNPEVKQRRRETHFDIQSGSLAENVKKSSVVVRNPKHIAVCLHYERGSTPLPEVLEIGRDRVALHIVTLAERAGIPIVENVPVARALASRVSPGQCIPSDLFEPVAHILRVAMQLNYDDAEN